MGKPELFALCLLAGVVFVLATALSSDGGLELEANHKASVEEGKRVLTISGTIVNTSSKTRSVPNARLVFRDQRSLEILMRETTPSHRLLGPDDRATFSMHFESPPEDAADVEISLVGLRHSPLSDLPWKW